MLQSGDSAQYEQSQDRRNKEASVTSNDSHEQLTTPDLSTAPSPTVSAACSEPIEELVTQDLSLMVGNDTSLKPVLVESLSIIGAEL